MRSIFRYSPQQYNDSLMALGNLRIGTLYDFRKSEHRAGISDPKEGKKSVSHYIDEYDSQYKDSVNHKAMEHFELFGVSGDGSLVMKNFTMERLFDAPDCYVHCTSAEYSGSAMSSLDGADSCIEIFDPASFYRAVTDTISLHANVRFLGVKVVRYRERSEVWNGLDWGDHPVTIKEPVFKPQAELRAIWVPKENMKLEPIVLNDVELIKHCRKVSAPK